MIVWRSDRFRPISLMSTGAHAGRIWSTAVGRKEGRKEGKGGREGVSRRKIQRREVCVM